MGSRCIAALCQSKAGKGSVSVPGPVIQTLQGNGIGLSEGRGHSGLAPLTTVFCVADDISRRVVLIPHRDRMLSMGYGRQDGYDLKKPRGAAENQERSRVTILLHCQVYHW